MDSGDGTKVVDCSGSGDLNWDPMGVPNGAVL